jgi:dGTPase
MDVEDAYKLKILSFSETKELYLNFFNSPDQKSERDGILSTLKIVTDPNEQISYLRARVITLLVNCCSMLLLFNTSYP